MQETIKSLWNGLYKPANTDIEYSENEKDLYKALHNYEKELESKIPDEETAMLFRRYKAAQMLYHEYQLEAAFAKGFSTGLKLTYEATSPKLELL